MHMRRLLVTHHAPDLDAVGALWMLKRFDAQHFASARLAFVNPGSTLSLQEAMELGFEPHEITHVDTGLGEFDHHQPDRGKLFLSATSLTYKHVCQLHPDLTSDKSLAFLQEYITQIDHFGEVDWPEPDHPRYCFMLHELLRGGEFSDRFDDEVQATFGMQCLDNVYASLNQHFVALTEIAESGQVFELTAGKALAIETSNDDTIKLAQKKGFVLVIKKDAKLGNIRIKARPDAELTLEQLHQAILTQDSEGTWYYHPSGKMLINGSQKHRNQVPTPLLLNDVKTLVQRLYGGANAR